MKVRKKAGAKHMDNKGGSGATGMIETTKESAKEVLMGHTGEMDNEED